MAINPQAKYEAYLRSVCDDGRALANIPIADRTRDLVTKAIDSSPLAYEFVPPALKREFAWLAIQGDPVNNLAFVIQAFESREEPLPLPAGTGRASTPAAAVPTLEKLMREAVRLNPLAIQKITNPNRDLVLQAVTQDGNVLGLVKDKKSSDGLSFGEDFEIVMRAVASAGRALRFADHELRKKEVVALAAVAEDGWALQYVLSEAQTRRVVQTAIAQSGPQVLKYAPLSFFAEPVFSFRLDEGLRAYTYDRQTRQIVEDALVLQPLDLQYASPAFRNNITIVLRTVQYNGDALEFADESLKGNEQIVFAAVSNKGSALRFASEALRGKREIVAAACCRDPSALRFATKAEVVHFVSMKGEALEYVGEVFKEDLSVVEAAVRNELQAFRFAGRRPVANYLSKIGALLQYASPEVQADCDLVTLAVQSEPSALRFAAPAVKDSESVVFFAVSKDGLALEHASERLRREVSSDRESPLIFAIRENGLAIQFVDPSLRRWHFLAMTAVKKNGLALRFLPPAMGGVYTVPTTPRRVAIGASSRREIRGRGPQIATPHPVPDSSAKSVVEAAVSQTGAALQFADPLYCSDLEIVKKAMRFDSPEEDPSPIQFAHREVVGILLSRKPSLFVHVSETLQDDTGIALFAVTKDGLNLRYASKRLRDQTDIVYAAVRNKGLAIQFASDRLQADSKIALAAVEQNGYALKFVDRSVWDYSAVVYQAVSTTPFALQYVPNTFWFYTRAVLKAVSKNGLAIQYMKREDLWFYHLDVWMRPIIKAAVRSDSYALHHTEAYWCLDFSVIECAIKSRKNGGEKAAVLIFNVGGSKTIPLLEKVRVRNPDLLSQAFIERMKSIPPRQT